MGSDDITATAPHSNRVAQFLNTLPIGLGPSEAVRAIAAIAARISDGYSQGDAPTSFAHVQGTCPSSVESALVFLEDRDCTPDLLGLAWEHLLADETRRSQGSHFTPREAAERVAALAIDEVSWEDEGSPLVWDPAAGGGAFLLAAARRIESLTSASRPSIVEAMFASDIDSTALLVCRASLEMWCGGEAAPRAANADALLDLPLDWPTNFALIVGNPPFLGQLTTDTARSSDLLDRLKNEYGSVATGYVDQSALFVEAGIRRLGPGGVLGLILPQSFLGARDVTEVRSSVMKQGSLKSLWIDDVGVFAAAVDVLAVVISADGEGRTDTSLAEGQRAMVYLGNGEGKALSVPTAKTWAPLLAGAHGIPVVAGTRSQRRIADLAAVTAGFRQHFYGIADAVVESEDVSRSHPGRPKLMTAGTIDPLASLWGARPIKFAGTKWKAPELVLERIPDAGVQKWFEDRLVPKLLLASQTPVLEVVADPTGTTVPSVPVISVEPHDVSMLWHLAAAITAPTTCAILLADAAGTGMSSKAIRVRASAIGDAALPAPSSAWDDGANAARRAHKCWLSGDKDGYRGALEALAGHMCEAYGENSALADWWLARLR